MRHNTKLKIVLASGSPRRALLLKRLGIEFSVLPSDINEKNVKAVEPEDYVKDIASLKARSVSKKARKGIIIGADTAVVIGGRILGKPKDERDAFRMLRILSGKTHTVMTGVCVINKYTRDKKSISVSTKVRFRRLSNRMIKWYINTGEPMGKAGSYAIQGKGAVLVERIDGDYCNVVGLPLTALATILERMDALHYAKVS